MLCATVTPKLLGFDDDAYCIVMRYKLSGHAFLVYVDDYCSVLKAYQYEVKTSSDEHYDMAMMPLVMALDMFDHLGMLNFTI